MIKRIIVDGNDGTGKTTRVNELKKLFPNITIEDRGIFSEATLDENIFIKNNKTWKYESKFYREIKRNNDIIYI